MPTVMGAIVRAMIDFRKEILDNLQLSLEYHTEQLEEIKVHVEHKMAAQEKRMKIESESKFKQLLKEINISLDQQKSSLSFQMQDLQNQSAANIKMLLEVKYESESKFKDLRDSNKMFREEMKPLFDKNNAQIQEIRKTLNAVNSMSHFGGGWTMFQRRIDRSVDFHRNWTMYKHGFGNINGEHWLGLEKLHIMTSSGRHELLVLLEDFEGNSAYALYDEFKIASEEEKYKLTVGKYSGTAGDSLTYHNGMKFSTFDKDNDGYGSTHCAEAYEGGWWYRKCFRWFVFHELNLVTV
ncbi:ficolin-1-like [Anopheles ziemanni]|uniref:ficolin-1-like n=1 Tax=Anopheles coustani TaxID=139045 RepID=UPI002658CCDD|nr:ficolin-1-like [Anopheles coustani]XP_058178541.1 ficolin-1-like [Anopheles ziemanni]